MTSLSVAALQLLTRRGEPFEVPIRGVSMGTTIPDASIVRVEPVALSALRPFDVIAFRDGDRVVAHRIRFRARGHSVMLGDGYSIPDLPVRDDDILGRVTAIRDGPGWIGINQRGSLTVLAVLSVPLVSGALMISPWLARKAAAALILFRRGASR